jgi:hypothetical protein
MYRTIVNFLRRGALRDFRSRDAALVQAAIKRGLNEGQIAVVRDYLAQELDHLSVTSVRNSRRMAWVLTVSVVGNGLVTIVTGTGLEIPGVLSNQKLSFYLAAVPTILGGIATGLLWEQKKVKSTEAMNALRMELWQFVGESVEYADVPLEEAWQKVSGSSERILQKYFSQDAIAGKKVENRGSAGRDR